MSEAATKSSREQNGPEGQISRFRLYAYLSPMILLPPLLIFAAISIVPSHWFAAHSGDPFLLTLGYGSRLHNTDCQVLISGDSTAMIGVDPRQIAQATGLSTCNIAETEGLTMVNGTMMVDIFLKHNPRPKYLVFMYAPESFDPESQRHNELVTTFEGVTFRFRQPDKIASFFAMMRHPEDVFAWAEHGLRWSVSATFAHPLPDSVENARFESGGQSQLHDSVMTSCNPKRRASVPNTTWISKLRSTYGVEGTEVVIDSAWLAECDPDKAYFRQHLEGVIDNQIETLPVQDFYVGGRHVTPAGSVPLSNMIANQIRRRMHNTPTAANR